MTPKVREFWDGVRQKLRLEYGQAPSERNRQVLERRKRLAQRLGIDHKTLKAFLNGRQIGMGPVALNRLLAIDEEISAKYVALDRNRQNDAQLPLDFGSSS